MRSVNVVRPLSSGSLSTVPSSPHSIKTLTCAMSQWLCYLVWERRGEVGRKGSAHQVGRRRGASTIGIAFHGPIQSTQHQNTHLRETVPSVRVTWSFVHVCECMDMAVSRLGLVSMEMGVSWGQSRGRRTPKQSRHAPSCTSSTCLKV